MVVSLHPFLISAVDISLSFRHSPIIFCFQFSFLLCTRQLLTRYIRDELLSCHVRDELLSSHVRDELLSSHVRDELLISHVRDELLSSCVRNDGFVYVCVTQLS